MQDRKPDRRNLLQRTAGPYIRVKGWPRRRLAATTALPREAENDALREDLPRIIEIMRKHGDLPTDLADVSLVALCERRGVSTIASVDSDFDAYRLPRSKKFENVFFSPDSA